MLLRITEWANLKGKDVSNVRRALLRGNMPYTMINGKKYIDSDEEWYVDKKSRCLPISYTRIYRIWQGMKKRCTNPNYEPYKNYGGRGITICDEWMNDSKAFYKWAIEHGYDDDLQIDRINNDGNYEPSNCRWVTPKVNANNKRKTAYQIKIEKNDIHYKRQKFEFYAKEHNLKYALRYTKKELVDSGIFDDLISKYSPHQE